MSAILTVEQLISRRVVRDALAAGLFVSVYDGEEMVVKKSRSQAEIVAAMFSTGEDVLYFYREVDGAMVSAGWVTLIYGNGIDVISDYSAKAEAVLAGAKALADRYEARYARR